MNVLNPCSFMLERQDTPVWVLGSPSSPSSPREDTFLEMKLQKYIEHFYRPTFDGDIFGHEISMSTSLEQP